MANALKTLGANVESTRTSKQHLCDKVLIYSHCKKHLLDHLKQRVRKELRQVYKEPETAYAAMDFSGKGKIDVTNILSNVIIKRLNFEDCDIVSWLIRDQVFPNVNSSIDYARFKQTFFPYLFHI